LIPGGDGGGEPVDATEPFRANEDDTADDMINIPTPTSINDIPTYSVFAYTRGKIGKSTARIQMQVRRTFIPRNMKAR
jgi:hypothetical protein